MSFGELSQSAIECGMWPPSEEQQIQISQLRRRLIVERLTSAIAIASLGESALRQCDECEGPWGGNFCSDCNISWAPRVIERIVMEGP